MRIGVVSDTHDRQEAVAEAVRLLLEQQVELILHCGDIESPETVRVFKPVPTHFVFGNWDKDRAPLALAGLWECWEAPDGELIESCSIITTPANELVAPLHDRMPVLIDLAGVTVVRAPL